MESYKKLLVDPDNFLDVQSLQKSKLLKATKAVETACVHHSPSPVQTREDDELKEVSSEMPMYLLAEDEGNEEEILRLLEGIPPSSSSTSSSVSCSKPHKELGQIESSMMNRRQPLSLDSSHESSNLESPMETVSLDEAFTSSSRHDSLGNVKHGGGWPKGKSRRPAGVLLHPKPPVTGYCLYLSANKFAMQQECGTTSMSVLSRRLGKMWSDLSVEQKNVFYSKAKADRVRYLDELRKYLADSYKEIDLVKANTIISKSFEGETNDKVLVCGLCELQFSSLYNKQSHYSGKLHLQTLLQHLNELVRETKQDTDNRPTRTPEASQPSLSTSLAAMATECDDIAESLCDIRVMVNKKLEHHATLQSTTKEAEYFKLYYCEVLVASKQKGEELEQTLYNLIHWFPKM